MEKVLVNNRTIAEMTSLTGPEGNWLLSPLLLFGTNPVSKSGDKIEGISPTSA
jgi:hypothetical protein